MNPKNLRLIEQKLREAVTKIVFLKEGEPQTLPFAYRGGGLYVGYGHDVHDLLKDVTRIVLLNERWADRLSEKTANDRFRKLFLQLVAAPDDSALPSLIQEVLDWFAESTRDHWVFLPLYGLDLQIEQLRIGQIALENMTRERIETIASANVGLIGDHFRIMESGVYAVFKTVAESERAKEIAVEETRRVLDLLRLTINALNLDTGSGTHILLGIESETNYNTDHRIIAVIPSDGTSYEFHWGTGREYLPFRLDDEMKGRMESIGIFTISNLLQKPYSQITDFEQTLLRAIHWFANFQSLFENESKLLCLITSLETFFTPKDGNPIGTAIAEGVALVSSEELEARKRIKRQVREMYKMRSAVSHGGQKAVLDEELADLFEITRTLMLRMIGRAHEFKNRDALLAWIDDQKLG